MKKAVFNSNGFPLAFYDVEINGDGIPAEAIDIADQEWREFINNQGRRRMVDGKVVPYNPPPVPDPVPELVSRAQAKIALSRAGLLPAVEQKVAEAGGEVAIWYADALNWRRDNAYIASLGAALGLSSEAIDALFQQAAQIAV